MYWLHHLLCGLSSGCHRGNGDPLSPRQGYFGPRSHGTRPQTQLGPRPLLPDETPGGQRRKEKNLTTDFTDYTDSEFGFGSWAVAVDTQVGLCFGPRIGRGLLHKFL